MSSDPTPSRQEWRFRLILVAASLFLSAATGEAALRLLGIGKPPSGDPGGLTFFAHDQNLGWDLVPGAKDRLETPEFSIDISITEQGLRSHRSFAESAGEGHRRLLVLGDSFTFGHGVQVEEAWPARVEALVPNLEVVNLAVTGYGTDQQLMRFEERFRDFTPDAVVLGLFVGNIFRNARLEQLGYAKPRFRLEHGELRLAGVPVPAERPNQSGSRLFGLLAGGSRSLAEHLGYGEAWKVTSAILERLDQRCRELNVPLYVIIVPKDQMIYGSGLRLEMHERTMDSVHEMLLTGDLPFLDLTTTLRENIDGSGAEKTGAERLYFPQDGHWTVAGHRIAARAIATWLAPQLPEPRHDPGRSSAGPGASEISSSPNPPDSLPERGNTP